ncbi:MAG: molybdopterin-dependent oxidoreductase [Alphaproteobacteria bacterium]|nr:molybdopterin-dependent oxidoreductase [Alphaproteobacteria bacterium]
MEPLKFGIGQPVTRSEDPRLLTGGGCYTDDTSVAGQLYARFVRAQMAHGAIRSIDTAAAAAMPGVVAVYTGKDLDDDGLGTVPSALPLKNRDGSSYFVPPRPGLALDRVRHVGDPIAVVVAETAAQAEDAAEAVLVDIDSLPALTDMTHARDAGAPRIWDGAPDNISLDFYMGDEAACDAAFTAAAHVSRIRIDNTRMVVNAMEPRAVLGEYDPATERFTVHMPSQGVTGVRATLARAIFKVPAEKMRVISNDVGGSFGMKGGMFCEPICVLYAARRLGRPVKWTASRSESFVSDHQGRASVIDAELALDAEGHFTGLRVRGVGDLGAYVMPMGPISPTRVIAANIISVYRTPALSYSVQMAFTNTVPTGPYRGAGRPESKYILERLIDRAAHETGIDRIEIRRRNLIPPDAFPWKAPNGQVYDSGEFEAIMDAALERADWAGFESRRAEAAARGRLRGIGVSCYLENTAPASELADIRFGEDGTVTLITGTHDLGTGHRTPFAQIIVEKLGVPYEAIRLVQNDSDMMSAGASGSGGSKSLLGTGSAIVDASALIVENGRKAAAHILEAAEEDIEFAAGAFTVAGTDRAIGIMELARTLRERDELPEGVPRALDARAVHEASPSTFPNGCHVCEVEIDPDTGVTEILRYTVVDDFGVVINPFVVEGQVHGGIVQGIGQILTENTVYDGDGQLITGSYMDYGMPRADDVPSFDFTTRNVPCVTNPLGIKGCGEAGNGGSMPAVMNAIVDALAVRGIADMDAPATPNRVWKALRDAEGN